MRVYIYYVLYDIQNSHPMRIPPSVSSILFSSSISSSGALERPPPSLTAFPTCVSSFRYLLYKVFPILRCNFSSRNVSKEHPRPDHPATCNYFLIYITVANRDHVARYPSHLTLFKSLVSMFVCFVVSNPLSIPFFLASLFFSLSDLLFVVAERKSGRSITRFRISRDRINSSSEPKWSYV